jgi:3'-5' exonuclease
MLNNIRLDNILFLDIETVPLISGYNDLSEQEKDLWDKKSAYMQEREQKTSSEVYEKAGIFAEFGKIVCISVGFIVMKENIPNLRIKSFANHDENIVLSEFINLLNKYFNDDKNLLCAHNGKEFDFPYIARRILVTGLKLPKLLDIAGKKPWEINHLDTMELWKFGDYKHFTSLNLLTKIFNIPTPKDDIDGSDVARVYWEEDDLNRIVIYCQKDVVALTNLLLRYKGMDLIDENNIEFV